MRKLYFILFFFICSTTIGQSQTISQTFVDRCTNEVKIVTANFVNGSATVAFYNRVKTFTWAEYTNGTLEAWLNETYAWWLNLSPCSTNIANQQSAQQTTSTTTTNATNAANNATSSTTNTTNTTNTNTNGNTGSTSTGSTSSGSGSNSTGSRNSSGNSGGDSNNSSPSESDSSGSSSPSDNTGGDSSNNESNNTGGDSSGDNSNSSQSSGGEDSSGDNSSDNDNNSSDSDNSSGDGDSGDGDSSGEEGGDSSGEGEESNEDSSSEENSEEQSEENSDEESSEESEEEVEEESSEEESEEEEKKKEKKEEKKKRNPINVAANVMTQSALDGTINRAINFGLSKSSLTGETTYSANLMVWDNLQQFSLNLSQSYVYFNHDKEVKIYFFNPETKKKDLYFGSYYTKGSIMMIQSTSASFMYIYGTKVASFGLSNVFLGQKENFWKGFVGGYALSGTIINIDDTVMIMPSGVLFGTKPFPIKRVTISPMIALALNPVSYSFDIKKKTLEGDLTWNEHVTYIVGSNFDVGITQRFRFNIGGNITGTTLPGIPITWSATIGSKFQF